MIINKARSWDNKKTNKVKLSILNSKSTLIFVIKWEKRERERKKKKIFKTSVLKNKKKDKYERMKNQEIFYSFK